jgi:D-glycero-alpha-D-manno-heptose-7-phosphate kinase
MSFEVLAPVRADLAGGTLDLWPLYCLHLGSITVNAALRSGVRIRLTPGAAPAGRIVHTAPGRPPVTLNPADAGSHLSAAVGFHFVPEGGFSVEVLEQPPVGSGLGASSAFAVALARACLVLKGRRPGSAKLLATLKDLEARVLGVPTGVQDYIPALNGGVVAIHLEPGGERVERLAVDPTWIEQRLVVLFSGVTHASGMVNWEVYRARLDGDAGSARALDAIAAAAVACRHSLLAGDQDAVGRAVAAEWEARRTLAPSVTNPRLDAILSAGLQAGALAGKACGAGGGGSVLFWTPSELRPLVAKAALAEAPSGACEIIGGLASRGAVVRSRRATMSRPRA